MFSFDMTCTFCNAVFEIDKKLKIDMGKTRDIPISMATDVLQMIFLLSHHLTHK